MGIFLGENDSVNVSANNVMAVMGGKFGVGVVTPTKDIHTGNAAGANMLFSREDATTISGELLGEVLFDSSDAASTTDASAAIRAYASIAHATTDKGGYLTFWTKADTANNNEAAVERMRISSAGNVGIGVTTNPTEALTMGEVGTAKNILLREDNSQITWLDQGGAANGNHTITARRSACGTQDWLLLGNSDFTGGPGSVAGPLTIGSGGQYYTFLWPIESCGWTDATVSMGTRAAGVSAALNLYNYENAGVGYGTRMIFSSKRTTGGQTQYATIDMVPTNVGDATYAGDFVFRAATAGAVGERLRITGAGAVGIGQTAPNQGMVEVKGGSVCVDTNSDNNASSCIANESDVRLKRNIEDLPYGLDTVMQLRPVSFDWRTDDPEVLKHYNLISRFADRPHSIGLIAQDVEKVIPEAIEPETVGDAEVQYLQLDYTKLVPVLIKGMQDLKAENDALRARVEALESAAR